jgi:putative ABC transport system permease protein
MSIAFRKVWRDLWNNKGRTTLVVLSIAVGVMAVGMIFSSNFIISRQLRIAQNIDQLAHAIMFLSSPVDVEMLNSLAHLPGVKEIDGWIEASLRWKPALDAEWKDATLIALDDYKQQTLNIIGLRSGEWPGPDAIAVQFNHVTPYNVPPVGGTIYFEVNNRVKPIKIGGIVRDPFQLPPPFAQNVAFYTSRDLMQKLAGFSDFNRLRFTINGATDADVKVVADAVEKKLERAGVSVAQILTYKPGDHPFQETLNGFGVVLTVMAVASLGLSTFLVVNTINAVIAQQIPQIGIMKTVGGIRSEIARLYLAGVAVYGILSLVLAVPLGALAGDALSRGLLTTLNIPAASFEVLPASFAYQIVAGLLTPLIAALWPVVQGTAVSVREAIAAYGLGQGKYGGRWMDKVMGRVQGLPRMMTLALRNTFRRMGRVALTEITLVAAGAIFMMIVAASSSFNSTLDEFWKGFGFDVLLGFNQSQRIEEVIPQIQAHPEVAFAEMWIWQSAKIQKAGASGPGSERKIDLRAVPVDTRLYTPKLTAGRALDPNDGHALLMDQKLAKEMGINVGDHVRLKFAGIGESQWTIVGLIFDVIGDTGYLHLTTLSKELNQVGQGSVVEIRAKTSTLETQQTISRDLRNYFKSQGVTIGFALIEKEFRQQQDAAFSVITNILQVMTILMAIVGSLGLSGTLSINVFERRREIGVMRAVGASSLDVALIFMGEGLLLGVVSWTIAVPISLIAGKYFVDALGAVFSFPFVYAYPPGAPLTWLTIVVVLSLLASWLPARRATQISVRESLAYE